MRSLGSITGIFSKLTPIAELLTRLTVGFVFLQSGYGKFTHLQKAIEFFESLSIPHAHLQAPVVAAMELSCGAFLLFGLATRFAAIPPIVIMIMAIRTAKWDDITDLSSLLGTSEFLYIVLLSWLVARGSGKVSLDAFLRRKFCGSSCA